MNKLYWLTPLILFIFQLIFTLNSQTQIRYEELAEGVRNPFWLSQGFIYDGVSSNIGWYGTLLIIYKIFGFDLFLTAKFFKLALFFVSITCMGLLLKRYIRNPAIPLLVIGLSPTLLYYNTSQTSHGIDLLYFPICLFLIMHARRPLARLAGWALAMWAWMSYPTFIFYLPALAIKGGIRGIRGIRGILISLAAFVLPLVVMLLLIKNRSLLLFDPQISSGIFRGAGGFDLSQNNISRNLGGFFTDLFVGGKSYHFEVYSGEFSLIFPITTVILVLILSFKLKEIRGKWGIGVIGGLVLVLVLSSFTYDPSGAPGIRRYTPVLAAFYALFVIAWQYINRVQGTGYRVQLMKTTMFLLLLHHLIVYPINLIHLKDPSSDPYPIWFNSAETPKKSLDNLLDQVKKEDLKLVCLDQLGQPFYCRLAEVYSAVAGSCVWNKLDCHQILGYDFKKGQFISLNVKLWDEYYFEH